MFDEELLEECTALLLSNGFEMGRCIYPLSKNIIPNAIVGIENNGNCWYGDLDISSDISSLEKVAQQLGKNLVIQIGDDSQTVLVQMSK